MRPHVAGHDPPVCAGCRAERDGLATWRRAQVEHVLARLCAHKLGDELRGFVLHDEAPGGEGLEAERMTLEYVESV